MNLFNLEAVDEDKLSQLNYGNRFEIYCNSRKSFWNDPKLSNGSENNLKLWTEMKVDGPSRLNWTAHQRTVLGYRRQSTT